jgi:hypothetical protein
MRYLCSKFTITTAISLLTVVLFFGTATADKPGKSSQGSGHSWAIPILTTYSIYDHDLQMEAFSILVPEGWSCQGNVSWVPEGHIANPVTYSFGAVDPGSMDAVSIYPKMLMVAFGQNSPMAMYYPEGSMCNGAEVCQPYGSADYITEYFLPLYQQHVGPVRVVSSEQLPDLAEATLDEAYETITSSEGSQYQWDADAAKVRLSYEVQGHPVEEDVVVSTMYCTDPVNQIMIWGVMSLTACRSSEGGLDERDALFGTIVASMRENPEWHAAVEDVQQTLLSQQAAQLPSRFQASNYATRRSYSGLCTDGWEARSETLDRVGSSYSDAIMGVDTYYDPGTEMDVEIPTGSIGWSNGDGDIIPTDDPLFDPNVDLEYTGSDWYTLD